MLSLAVLTVEIVVQVLRRDLFSGSAIGATAPLARVTPDFSSDLGFRLGGSSCSSGPARSHL